jgi:hypothetical protein
MSIQKETAEISSEQNINIFLKRFFVAGARNHIRKTTSNAPWLSLGIMEKNCAGLINNKKLFADMNIVSGGAYSLGHGFINGYLTDEMQDHIRNAVNLLNALPAKEIIFYHDESFHGLDIAQEMGWPVKFTPVSMLEWLLRKVDELSSQIRPLNKKVAVQLPYSMSISNKRHALIDELFEHIGIERVERFYDKNNYLYSGALGYFGLLSGNIHNDTDAADDLVSKNIADVCNANADYLVTFCPFCYAALATAAEENDIIPVQIEDLVNVALYGDLPEGGLRIL